MAHPNVTNIYGSTFNSAQGDLNIYSRDPEPGLHTLRLAVSLEAIHDSAERYPAPNCHPDTRKAVRQIILDWIHNDSVAFPFFWLYGAPGVGKTAILQAIAEVLCSPSGTDGNFGGSFFFSRGKNGRDQGHFLFSTLAYQLALKVPGLRQHVNRIMEANPELHTKSMTIQLQTLIVDSFRYLSPLPQYSYLVIIDGLDECHDKATQESILRLLCETITVHKLPLRFLIGSRPEFHIRVSFDQKSLYTITRRVVLDETFKPARDIEVFLRDGFMKICANNPILAHVKQPWPEEGIIDLLVQRSSGQFIYATTVLKFVGADFGSPTTQLALILKPDRTAFSDLDQLYTQILSIYPSTVNITQILGIIVAFTNNDLTPEVIEDILGMEEGELKVVLQGLSSLIAFQNDENGEYLTGNVISNVVGRPYFLHTSFGDFLVDSSRSGPFHVNPEEHKHKATICSFALITKSIRGSWTIPTSTRFPHSKTWTFFRLYLSVHFYFSPMVVKEAIMTDINNVVQEFWRTSSDGAVDVSFYAMRRLLEIFQTSAISDKFNTIFNGYQRMLDQSFSKSKDLGDLLRFLPGIVVQKRLSMQGMAELYRVEMDLLERSIESTIEPLNDVSSPAKYMLDDYLSEFLQDRGRSQLCYCDPILHHVSICRHFLAFLDESNADFQSYDLPQYVRFNLFEHLCAVTMDFLDRQDIPDPAVQILNALESTTYHFVYDANVVRYDLVQCIIQAILRWADMLTTRLKGTPVFISDTDLREQLRRLTNRIYREMLCIKRHGSIVIVTMGKHDRFQVNAFSRTPHYSTLLSWDLLSWISMEDRIFPSFTTFITTPEISGPMHISADVYHTQITEYSLETIFRHYHRSSRPSPLCAYDCFLPSPNWSFGEHLSHALPTEMIFDLLRSIPSRALVRDYSAKSILDLLEIIIEWLEELGPERPSDLYDRFQGECKHEDLGNREHAKYYVPMVTTSYHP